MKSPDELNVLVVSDIHAVNGDPLHDSAVSYFSTRATSLSNPLSNPFLSIPRILRERNLDVDWVLSPVIWLIGRILQRKRLLGSSLNN